MGVDFEVTILFFLKLFTCHICVSSCHQFYYFFSYTGSGSTYLYGYCDAHYKSGMSKDETIDFVKNSKSCTVDERINDKKRNVKVHSTYIHVKAETRFGEELCYI